MREWMDPLAPRPHRNERQQGLDIKLYRGRYPRDRVLEFVPAVLFLVNPMPRAHCLSVLLAR
jgi:hypothetical protein